MASSKGLVVVGTCGIRPARAISSSSRSSLSELLDIAKTGKIPQVPTKTRPLDEANAALDDLRQGRVIGRTVLIAA